MENKKKVPKRIIFDVSEYEHALIKTKASECRMKIGRYIMRAVMIEIRKELKGTE